jgi:hypothetical protein
VLQRPLHQARLPASLTVPAATAGLKTLRQASTQEVKKASNIKVRQAHKFR